MQKCNKHIYVFVFLLGVTLCCLPQVVRAQDYRVFRHKISQDGNRISVKMAVQSAAGYMWFASDKGLVRYDGYGELFFPFPKGYTVVTALFFDADTGYVGFADGNILTLKNGHFAAVGWEEGTPKSEITAIVKDAHRNLWLGSEQEGVYVHDGRYLHHIGKEDGLPDLSINDMAADGVGGVWVATDRGLVRLAFSGKKKNVQPIGVQQGLPDLLVTTLSVVENKLYGGTHSGKIFELNITNRQISELKNITQKQPIEDLWADGTELWGLDAEGGLFMYSALRNHEYIYIENKKLNAEGRIRHIIADDEYNLWLTDGSENVLRIYRGILHVDKHENFSFKGITSISCDKKGYLYFTTPEGMFSHPVVFRDEYVMRQFITAGADNWQPISIYTDASGRIWVGTFGNGLYSVFNGGLTVSMFNEQYGFINNNILNITGHRNQVWAATLDGVAYFENGQYDEANIIGRASGMPVGFNYCVGYDSVSQTLWVGTDGGGLVKIRDGRLAQTLSKGPNTVYSLAVMPGVGVIFSGEEPGLWAYDGKTMHNFSNWFQFSTITPTGLTVLPDSSVIILHAKGFERFYPFKKSNTSFGESYGIGSFENTLNAISVDEYNNCWLASDNELLRLSAIPLPYRKSPKTILDEVQVMSDVVPFSKHVFSFHENSFTFRFSGIWFQDEENVGFAYKMDGIDKEWRITGDHYANYPALPPGTYTFRVKSSATGSFQHPEEVVYTFEIEKPYWEEVWFFLPILFMGGAIFYVLLRVRDKRVADKERMQKENAEFRFQVLKNQISPHFLFNSFNTLLYLIDSDKNKASHYTEELSDFFRKVLEVREQNLISLREEVELMNVYASLQQSRFEHALKVDIEIEEKYLETFIPPLSGQMLLENAIKHNSVSRENPLVFQVRIRDGKWVEFSNNIQLRRGKTESTGIGLKNIAQRYRLLNYPEPEIHASTHTFTVLLPLVV